MKINKLSQIIICSVLSCCFLTACNGYTPGLPMPGKPKAINTAKPSSIWGSISEHFELDPHIDNKAVSKQIAYLQKNSDDLNTILRKAGPYISYVFVKTQQKKMPAELALLPIVESEYSPLAKSRVGASGLWQIMPRTGSELGLKKSSSYDGRRDIVASTRVALAFLDDLHHEFNNWELALAAYNWGPGNIERSIKNSHKWFGKPSFWDLNHLPKETRDYVPKLYALAAVIKNPARYHIQLPAITAEPQIAALKVGPKVDLKKMAQSTGISVETIRKLNPGYQTLATSKGAPNTVLVPVDKVEAIKPIVPVLAVQTVSVKPQANETIKKVTEQSVIDKLIREGEWFLIALANIPSSNAYAASLRKT